MVHDGISILDNYTVALTDGLSGKYATDNDETQYIAMIYGSTCLCSISAIAERYRSLLAGVLKDVSPIHVLADADACKTNCC